MPLLQSLGLALFLLLGSGHPDRVPLEPEVQARTAPTPVEASEAAIAASNTSVRPEALDARPAGGSEDPGLGSSSVQSGAEDEPDNEHEPGGEDEPGEEDEVGEEDESEADSTPAEPAIPVEQFLQESPHPVLVSIAADYLVYSSERKLLYARGNVRYSGRGFVVAAEVARLDLGSQRALLSSVRGVLRRGREARSFTGDVLHLDMQLRRAVSINYGDRIVTERIWFPEKTEVETSELTVYFRDLENAPMEAELGVILEGRLYLEMERVKIDPQSRLRAWGVQPYIEGAPGPRLPYFSFRTGDAQPRQGLSIRSLGASNVSGIRADVGYSLSPAERLLTTFNFRYEELSLLHDPFRPDRRARFGLLQNIWINDNYEANVGGYYQTDEEWEGAAALEFQHGPHSASLATVIQNNVVTGRHDRIRARHGFDREDLRSELSADFDLGTELDLRWNFGGRAWKDHFQFQSSSNYLKRFDHGLYQKAEVLTTNTVASLNVSSFLTTLSYLGVQDLELNQVRHNPALSLEILPQSIGAGLLASFGNSVQLTSETVPASIAGYDGTTLNDEIWGVVQHVPIYFTERLSYDARVRVSQRLLEGIEDESTLEALGTFTRRFGQVSSASLGYRYQTVRQTSSEWLTVGRVAQEVLGSAQFRLDRKKQLIGQARYSLSESAPLDAYLQFSGEFGPAWKGSLRSGFDFQREKFNVLDVSLARDMFFGWMTVTYRQVQNELTIEYIAKLF